MISAILISSGRNERMEESIAAFLSQSFSDRELVIVNNEPRQSFTYEHPLVRIVSMRVPSPVSKAVAAGVEAASGDVLVIWSEMDYYLPWFLDSVALAIDGNDWCGFSQEVLLQAGSKASVVPSSELSFAFTRNAWKLVGSRFGLVEDFFIRVSGTLKGGVHHLARSKIGVIRVGTQHERQLVSPSIRCGPIKLVPHARADYRMAVSCDSELRSGGVCVVELGRFGDIINILPFLQHIHETSGTPSLCVSKEFETLLEGVSYVKPFVTELKNEELGLAIEACKRSFKVVVNAQIWGRGWQQKKTTPAYNMESWANCGWLHKFGDQSLRPVFDRRSPEREKALIELALAGSDKPMILVNVSKAVSSPCPQCSPLFNEIKSFWQQYHVVDLSKIRAERLYDFIGLFEVAACLVSVDTSFLHLAPATKIPVVAITNPREWAGTEVRCGNLAGRMTYDEVSQRPQFIHECIDAALEKWNDKESGPAESAAVKSAPVRRIFHCVERHHEPDLNYQGRKMMAWKSWDSLYAAGRMLPAHYWNYDRTADKVCGDSRPLPFLKDLLMFAMRQAEPHDIIFWTNDDNPLHPEVADYVRFHVGTYGPCTSFRSEFVGPLPPLDLTPEQFDIGSIKHMGRDIFAATKSWLEKNWDRIPDFIIGCSDFDLCLAALVRLEHGIQTTNQNISQQMFPAEMRRGYVAHQHHSSHWSRPDYQNTSPGQLWNRRLFREWAEKHCPTLVFNENSTLK